MRFMKNNWIKLLISLILLLPISNNIITGVQSQIQFNFSDEELDNSGITSSPENLLIHSRIAGIQLSENNTSNYQLNNTVLTEPLNLINCPNAQIINVTITNLTNTVVNAIILNNCSNSLIRNVTIQNVTATDSYASGITILNSDGTLITNTTISEVTSSASGFLSSKKAYGIIVNESVSVDINDVMINNITAISTSYGIFSENSAHLSINQSIISTISAESALGICVRNSDYSEILLNRLTTLNASTAKCVGISLEDCYLSSISLNNMSFITGNSFVYGIEVYNTDSISIINNSIDSLKSLSYMDLIAGINVLFSDYALIRYNSVTKIEASFNKAFGIAITEGFSPDLLNNFIESVSSTSDSAYGIEVDSCASTIIDGNNISEVWSSADTYSIPPDVLETTGYGINIMYSSFSSISFNQINLTTIWIFTDESSTDLTYNNNTIDSINAEINELNRPEDSVIEEMQASVIEWEVASTAQYYNYSIYRDGEIYKNSTYVFQSDFTISIDIEGMLIGVFNFLLVLQDHNGIIITDFVTIIVSESDMPIFISKPNATLYYQVGSTQEYLLWWTVNDSNPSTYRIYQNGTEISYRTWEALTPFNVSVGGLSLGIYNITIIVQDIAGNSIIDHLFIHVIPISEISITRNTDSLIEYDIYSESCVLNWTVHSIEGGTYNLFRGSNKEEKITRASFSPEEPIVYILPPDIPIGTHIYTLEIIDTTGNSAEASVSVKVISNPVIIEDTTTRVSFTAPPYTIPPYLSVPAAEFPWSLAMGILGGLGLAAITFFILTKRILVPKAIKVNRKELSRARKIKDKAGVADRLHQLGQTFLEIKDYEASIKHNKKALNLFNELGDKKGQLAALEALGDAYHIRGVEKKID